MARFLLQFAPVATNFSSAWALAASLLPACVASPLGEFRSAERGPSAKSEFHNTTWPLVRVNDRIVYRHNGTDWLTLQPVVEGVEIGPAPIKSWKIWVPEMGEAEDESIELGADGALLTSFPEEPAERSMLDKQPYSLAADRLRAVSVQLERMEDRAMINRLVDLGLIPPEVWQLPFWKGCLQHLFADLSCDVLRAVDEDSERVRQCQGEIDARCREVERVRWNPHDDEFVSVPTEDGPGVALQGPDDAPPTVSKCQETEDELRAAGTLGASEDGHCFVFAAEGLLAGGEPPVVWAHAGQELQLCAYFPTVVGETGDVACEGDAEPSVRNFPSALGAIGCCATTGQFMGSVQPHPGTGALFVTVSWKRDKSAGDEAPVAYEISVHR